MCRRRSRCSRRHSPADASCRQPHRAAVAMHGRVHRYGRPLSSERRWRNARRAVAGNAGSRDSSSGPAAASAAWRATPVNSPASTAAPMSRMASQIATPPRGLSPCVLNTPNGRFWRGNSVWPLADATQLGGNSDHALRRSYFALPLWPSLARSAYSEIYLGQLARGSFPMKTKSGRTRRETPAGNGEAFKLENFLPYRLSVAATRVSRLFARRYFEAFGLSIPEWRVLGSSAGLGAFSPSVVGEATAMDKVKVSRAAASLVARGLVGQTQDPQDGRGRLLRLTRRGVGVLECIAARVRTRGPACRGLEPLGMERIAEGAGRAQPARQGRPRR